MQNYEVVDTWSGSVVSVTATWAAASRSAERRNISCGYRGRYAARDC